MTRRRDAGWDALADPETGRLDRAMMHDVLIKPRRVDLRGAALVFESPVGEESRRKFFRKDGPGDVPTVRVKRDLLERFLGLGTDQAVLRFARTYGSLRGYGSADQVVLPETASGYGPFGHVAGLYRARGPRPRRAGDEFEESLELWRRCRDRFHALLALAAGWRQEHGPTRAVIDRIVELDLGGRVILMASTTASRRRQAARILTTWADYEAERISLRPGLRFNPSPDHNQQVDLVFRDLFSDTYGIGLSLYGALIVQMFSAVAGSGFAVCSSCGSAFIPSRRPTQDRRRYCATCGRRAALRDAKAAQRERERRNSGSDSSGR